VPGYTYLSSNIVKNKLGATTYEELERLEEPFVGLRRAQVDAGLGPVGEFDAAHLKALHQFLFQDVSEWAGHTRDERVRLSDGATATEPVMRKVGGAPFLIGTRITKALDRIATDIRRANFLCDLDPETFAVRAADIMAAINAAQPFREGNGRTQRTFIRELAKRAGHELDFSVISGERMIQASIAANEGRRPGMMRRLFKDAVIPARREASAKAIADLDAAGFAWNDRYIAAAEPRHSVELTLAGIAGAQFMGRTATAIIIGQSPDLPSPTPSRGQTFEPPRDSRRQFGLSQAAMA
jgi:cell filamentation protein